MAHAIWSGAINFGLVTIPVKLQTAIRTNDLRFNFLHKTDEGRINNVRRCSLDGQEVSYDDIVRGYEVEKGRYVILSDDDLKSVNPEATQSVDIVQFVDLTEINPMYFDKPYYLEPDKRGRHAYALLREALKTYSKWPTFPQLYVNGELVGGCDITLEMYKSGELKQLLAEAGAVAA